MNPKFLSQIHVANRSLVFPLGCTPSTYVTHTKQNSWCSPSHIFSSLTLSPSHSMAPPLTHPWGPDPDNHPWSFCSFTHSLPNPFQFKIYLTSPFLAPSLRPPYFTSSFLTSLLTDIYAFLLCILHTLTRVTLKNVNQMWSLICSPSHGFLLLS